MGDRIYILDTTLRDGEQTPMVNLNSNEKLEIAKVLTELKVDIIEAGFAVSSKGDFESIQRIGKEVKGPVIATLSRSVKKDIEVSAEALKYAENKRIHIFLATSPIHMKYKLKMTEDEVYERAVEMVKYARNLCDDIEFSCEDASRSELKFLYRIVEGIIDAGAKTINLPDTVGYASPEEYGAFIKSVIENVPNSDKAIYSVHCHNDLGLAVSNSLSAVLNGARQVEGAINGIGERAGNASLEEIAMALKVREDFYNCYTNIDTKKIYKTSKIVRELTGVEVQVNKAIVGANAFSHGSGIHQHGVLANPLTYEIMTPESVGVNTGSNIVLGKLSGKHAFEEKLKDLGFDNLTKEEISSSFMKFKELCDKKKTVEDRDIEALILDEKSDFEEVYKLKYFHISSGNSTISTSTVIILNGEEEIQEAACGDGPVDATFNAIQRALNTNVELIDYKIEAVTGGTDAQGQVRVKVKNNDKIYNGSGVSLDIIDASAKAFMSAVNKTFAEKI